MELLVVLNTFKLYTHYFIDRPFLQLGINTKNSLYKIN